MGQTTLKKLWLQIQSLKSLEKDKILMNWIYNSFSSNKLKYPFGNTKTHKYRISLAKNFHDNSNINLMQLCW